MYEFWDLCGTYKVYQKVLENKLRKFVYNLAKLYRFPFNFTIFDKNSKILISEKNFWTHDMYGLHTIQIHFLYRIEKFQNVILGIILV